LRTSGEGADPPLDGKHREKGCLLVKAFSRLFSQSWLQLSDHLGHGNGAIISSWRTIHVSGLEVFEVTPKSPSPTVVKPKSCSSIRSGPSDVNNGYALGFSVLTAIDGVGSWWRKRAFGPVERVADTIPGPVIVTGPARASIRSVGVPACPTDRETVIAQAEIARLLRATVRDLERRAKRGGKR